MIISIVIVEGAKQIMMTPETNHEKEVIEMIGTEDNLEVVKRLGSFTSDYNDHANLQVSECEGDYLRAFNNNKSIMFLIKDKKENK